MNINLTSFKVEFLRSGSIKFIMQTKEREINDKHPTFYIISRSELPLMLDCINGESKFYPFFDDGLYHIKVHPAGIVSYELHENKTNNYYFHIPLKELPKLLDTIYTHYSDPYIKEHTYELDSSELKSLKFEYRNRSSWIYHNHNYSRMELTPEGYNYIEYPINRIKHTILNDIKTHPELKDLLQRLNHIAKNNCFKDTVTIELSYDHIPVENKPTSYYFFIHENGKKIINGGIIAHKQNDETYNYSMHT